MYTLQDIQNISRLVDTKQHIKNLQLLTVALIMGIAFLLIMIYLIFTEVCELHVQQFIDVPMEVEPVTLAELPLHTLEGMDAQELKITETTLGKVPTSLGDYLRLVQPLYPDSSLTPQQTMKLKSLMQPSEQASNHLRGLGINSEINPLKWLQLPKT